jgi:hypothetical protein
MADSIARILEAGTKRGSLAMAAVKQHPKAEGLVFHVACIDLPGKAVRDALIIRIAL